VLKHVQNSIRLWANKLKQLNEKGINSVYMILYDSIKEKHEKQKV